MLLNRQGSCACPSHPEHYHSLIPVTKCSDSCDRLCDRIRLGLDWLVTGCVDWVIFLIQSLSHDWIFLVWELLHGLAFHWILWECLYGAGVVLLLFWEPNTAVVPPRPQQWKFCKVVLVIMYQTCCYGHFHTFVLFPTCGSWSVVYTRRVTHPKTVE